MHQETWVSVSTPKEGTHSHLAGLSPRKRLHLCLLWDLVHLGAWAPWIRQDFPLLSLSLLLLLLLLPRLGEASELLPTVPATDNAESKDIQALCQFL